MTKPIRKAIFPVAGLGTRFLPATKAMPKEMLTVVDRPAIQHVVDEARQGGAEHLIFVTGRNKGVIEDHFDRPFELEHTLRERNKLGALEELDRFLPAAGQTSFTRQQEPLGLGHAVWCARDIVGHEPFALLLPDVLVKTDGPSCMAQMMSIYNEMSAGGEKINLIAVEEVAKEEVSSYGIVGIEPGDGPLWQVNSMVEKPSAADAPSNLIIMGRYILQPEIFDILSSQERGAGNEIQITDAMKTLMKTQRFFAYKYSGRSFDCGSKLGFLVANAAFALDREDIGPRFAEEVRKLISG
jgi:UTP--glucose-1-phosphate uridylyltransferase